MTDTLHVRPLNDLIDHDTGTGTGTDQPDCPCGPEVQPIERDDGTFGWLLVHHSLDGRGAGAGTAGHRPPATRRGEVRSRVRRGGTHLSSRTRLRSEHQQAITQDDQL